MPTDDDLFLLDDGDDEAAGSASNAGWKVLIVDDDRQVHEVTSFVLRFFTFDDRGVEFRHAYSGAEGVEAVRREPDIAVVLLDVVMETDHAGLDAVRRIREEVGNHMVRIILRTGQPGLAPELQVISNYDINGYAEKTDLTIDKLYSLLYTSIRSFRAIRSLNENCRGLRRVIDSSAEVFAERGVGRFAPGALRQLTGLLQNGDGAANGSNASGVVADLVEGMRLIAGTGPYAEREGAPVNEVVSESLLQAVLQAADQQTVAVADSAYAAYFQSRTGARHVLGIETRDRLAETDKTLLGLFCRNLAAVFDNLHRQQEIDQVQREMVLLLAEAVERRSPQPGNHVRRVAELSRLLARAWGMTEEDADELAMAAPLHDLGTIAIPEAILNKPGPLTPAERTAVMTHARFGHAMMARSTSRIIRQGAVIALTHHEKWDGTGYPAGLAGEAIPLLGGSSPWPMSSTP